MDDLEQAIADLNSEDIDVRWHAANRFVNERSPQAVDKLIELLRDSDSAVRAKAAQALGRQYDQRAFGPLLAVLCDREPEVRATAAASISHCGLERKRLGPALMPLLYDKESEVRAAAVRSLGYAEGKRVLAELLHSLLDPDETVRAAACQGLGTFGSQKAKHALFKLIEHDEARNVRYRAIEALGNIGQPRTDPPTLRDLVFEDEDIVNYLINIVNDQDLEDTWMRSEAVEALREIGDSRAVPHLMAWACDWRCDDREEPIFTLGYLEDLRAVPYLIALLSDEDFHLHSYAAGALGKLGDPRALPELDRLAREGDETQQVYGGSERKAAQSAAEEIREQLTWKDFDCLKAYLAGDDENKRDDAVKCLGELDDPRAMDLILSAINDPNILVSGCAMKIVANAGETRALPLLAAAADYWREQKVPGCVEDAEAAAQHIRRKLNGEDVGPFISIVDDEYYADEDASDDEDDEDDDDDNAPLIGWVGGDSPEPDLDW